MNKYSLEFSTYFKRDLKKFKKNRIIKDKITSTLKKLSKEPFDSSLYTHQVNISSLGKVWSSRVTGDLRLIWKFNTLNEAIIIAIRIQGHDTVYR